MLYHEEIYFVQCLILTIVSIGQQILSNLWFLKKKVEIKGNDFKVIVSLKLILITSSNFLNYLTLSALANNLQTICACLGFYSSLCWEQSNNQLTKKANVSGFWGQSSSSWNHKLTVETMGNVIRYSVYRSGHICPIWYNIRPFIWVWQQASNCVKIYISSPNGCNEWAS